MMSRQEYASFFTKEQMNFFIIFMHLYMFVSMNDLSYFPFSQVFFQS